ncbi:MAG TPA: hypothetical protein VNO30_34920 [Kofleriaceae bacterium]|nr:hypothetical protein [Kofleriaceae bacterium]
MLSALEGRQLAMGRITSMLLGSLPYLELHRLWQLSPSLAAPRPGRY